MPEISREITVKAPLQATWDLVSDMERFSLCVPGCKEVKTISETEFDWKLETKVLRTTRKATARTRVVKMEPPTHAEFAGEGRLFERANYYKLTITGTTDLASLSAGKTRITFTGNVRAGGLGGAVIEKVAAGQLHGLLAEFEDNIKRALSGSARPEQMYKQS